jgi:hypothetical protein
MSPVPLATPTGVPFSFIFQVGCKSGSWQAPPRQTYARSIDLPHYLTKSPAEMAGAICIADFDLVLAI